MATLCTQASFFFPRADDDDSDDDTEAQPVSVVSCVAVLCT